MANLKLFMVLLGCTPRGRNTEQHDIFGVGEELQDLLRISSNSGRRPKEGFISMHGRRFPSQMAIAWKFYPGRLLQKKGQDYFSSILAATNRAILKSTITNWSSRLQTRGLLFSWQSKMRFIYMPDSRARNHMWTISLALT